MVTLHSATEREALPRKGGDYADKAISVLNERGYLVEDRAADSGIFADIELSRKFSHETVIAEAKNTTFKFSDYKSGFAHYFAKWYDGNFDEFHLYIKDLEKDDMWDLISNPEENLEELEKLFESLLQDAEDEFETPIEHIYFEDFRDFLANTEVFRYSYDELDRIHERIERTGEYDDKPFLTEYAPIPKEGILHSNLFTLASVPETLYCVETIDGFEEARTRNYNPDYYPVEPHGGDLYSLIPPAQLPSSTEHYIREDTVSEIDFTEWLNSAPGTDADNTARALLVRLVALKARNKDCRYDDGNNGALLYARYGDEYGEERTSDGIWVAKPADRRPEFRHRAIWVEARNFASAYYVVFKPTKEYTIDGETPVDSETKDELTHLFAGRMWPKNRRKRRLVDAWEAIIHEPVQTNIDGDTSDIITSDFEAISTQLELSRVEEFSLPNRPPKTAREQREMIRSPEIMTDDTKEFVKDMDEFL